MSWIPTFFERVMGSDNSEAGGKDAMGAGVSRVGMTL